MKKAYYFYITEDCKSDSQEMIDKLRSLDRDDCAVLVIGSNPDISKLKQEVNYLTDKKYHLFCLMTGHPEFDSGLKLQLGLAKMYENDYESVERLISDVNNYTNQNRSNIKIPALIIAAVILIAVICIILFARPNSSDPGATNLSVTTPDDENDEVLTLDDIYLQAFIDCGLDENSDGKISKDEMQLAISLDLSGLGISDLEPLLYAENLVELDLSNNNITDITKLAGLAKLEKLDLSDNAVEDYTVLDYLPNLKEIIK